MLKNKIIVKKIRNIFILLMAIIIMIGVYRNIRNSRAENVIQIEMEVADKNKLLENQTITVDATETKEGNFLVELPTSVNENIVTKYYTADGAEVTMTDENSDKTLRLTETEVANKKIEVETDYDTKEVTTTDNQTITLYNKELKVQNDENIEKQESAQQEKTKNTIEEDDVIVTGYMPLDTKTKITEIDLNELANIKLPKDTQTIQKGYEVSVYQEVKKETAQAENENNINENTETEEQTTAEKTNNETVEIEKVEYNPSIYAEKLKIKTKNKQ